PGYDLCVGRAEALWRQVKGARRWPGIAVPALEARVAGCCLVFGGLFMTALATITPAEFEGIGGVYAIAATALAAGVGTLIRGSRIRPWQFQILVGLAIVLITVTVILAQSAVMAVGVATLYTVVAFAAFFLSWPQTIGFLGFAVLSGALALASTPGVPFGAALIATCTTAIMGAVIASLGQLMSNSERDLLTGLPNRHGFDRIFASAVDRAQAGGPRPTVVLVVLEGLDAIGDKYGHQAGDQLIRSTVDGWRGVLHPEHILARLGDDEFAILLPSGTEHEGVALSHRIRMATATGCGAGVTAWQPDEAASVVLSRADVALRRAKRGGRNRTVLESAGAPTLAAELADAIAAGVVGVLYQPIVSLTEDNLIVGVEALARWESPTRPDLQISEVITVAENSNLISALDRYVLRRACSDVQWLQRQRADLPLTLTVNVSGLELIENGYPATVAETLAETGWPPSQLVLEVTESVVDVDTPASVAALRELRDQGIRVAMDDFGTGYSTLSRLQKLPIDLLKLDASFTAGTELDPASPPPPLLQAIAALARALDLPVVVEGVETERQALALRQTGFAMAQGYYSGRPQVTELLAQRLTAGSDVR
ncbi:bifunctional diguanylate cyclase/phosphodiesterase, partial [Mycolicibacterium murale]|uniref:putative bifunctional diguanylate cyclase/phosphodiesterase n=1 Tax=Mycolicibacterium murale TaxID=182220 RepID=UPI0031DC7543